MTKDKALKAAGATKVPSKILVVMKSKRKTSVKNRKFQRKLPCKEISLELPLTTMVVAAVTKWAALTKAKVQIDQYIQNLTQKKTSLNKNDHLG